MLCKSEAVTILECFDAVAWMAGRHPACKSTDRSMFQYAFTFILFNPIITAWVGQAGLGRWPA